MDIEKDAGHKGCGVYKIRLVNSKGSSIQIPRFLDKDSNGILQIGRSVNVERRTRGFRGAIEGKRYAHAEGQRLYLVKKYTNFMERYNNCKIQYSFERLPNESEAKKDEERLLKCYFRRYGEVPPLNNNLPDKNGWGSLK